jgi:hypothetical protein
MEQKSKDDSTIQSSSNDVELGDKDLSTDNNSENVTNSLEQDKRKDDGSSRFIFIYN